jgi:UrcA family protein
MQRITGLAGALVITTGMVAGFATNAEAAPPVGGETRSVAVRYADLDLNREAGARTLYQRLRNAARDVCGTANPRDLPGRAAVRECRSAALTDAVTRLGNERVAALHRVNDRRPAEAPRQIAARQ